MFEEDLIKGIIGNQISFGTESFPAVMYKGSAVIMVNDDTCESGFGNDYETGIIPLNDFCFCELEYIYKYKAIPMDEPTIYC